MALFSSLRGYQGPLPLFPLPNVVLFPHNFLPLHVFEPRYKQMVKETVEADGLVGIVLLKPGWKEDYYGNPPIFEMACMGQIARVDELSEGRYNILLHGLKRAKITRIESNRPYRRAKVQLFDEPEDSALKQTRLRKELFDSFSRALHSPSWGFTVFSAPHLDVGIMTDFIASALPCELQDKQTILEAVYLEERVYALIKLLEKEIAKGRRLRIRNLPFIHDLAVS